MSRKPSLRIGVAVFLCLVMMAGLLVFRGAGRWLERPDPLGAADVIAVLSGGLPWRAEEAARIFGLRDAREVWLTQPAEPSGLAAMGIPYRGDEYYNRAVLIRQGVPEGAVHVLSGEIVDTQQEIDEIAGEMRRDGDQTVIIVTSPQHTRRVKTLWRKLAGNDLRAIVRGSPEDPFDADHWWRDTGDLFSVAREIMGLMNAWAGFPVRPEVR